MEITRKGQGVQVKINFILDNILQYKVQRQRTDKVLLRNVKGITVQLYLQN